MRVDLIEVPYDSGHRNTRMGRGPGRLVEDGLTDRLERAGRAVRHRRMETALPFASEAAVAFELQRLTAAAVAGARADGAFPLVASGNCNIAAVGAVAGLGGGDTAVVWFDAHGDCETPDTTESAFLDGMGLAMLVGECWRGPLAALPGFSPLPHGRVVLIGPRQISEAELRLVARTGIAYVPVERLRAGAETALAPHFEGWRAGGVRRLYVHIDLDVLDPSIAPANSYAEPGGLSVAEVREAIDLAAAAVPVEAAALTAYDPTCDIDDRMLQAALDLGDHVVRVGAAGLR